ncbi:MAG: hypothetical protein ACRDWT_16330 [Jatrophihabitantaceae bacterium]
MTTEPARGDGAADELLEVGHEPRRPHRLETFGDRITPAVRWVAVAVTVCGLLLAYLVGRPSSSVRHATQPDATVGTAGTDALSVLVAKARQRGPLADYIRSDSSYGACASVRVGHDPGRAVVATLHRDLPGYAVRDVARTLDQFTALCTIDVRAANAHGSTVVVEVVSPQTGSTHAFTAVSISSIADPSTTAVTSASAITSAGWSVTVGVIGPRSDQPGAATLLSLAQDPTLLW